MLTGRDLDERLNYPRGRSERLARQGLIPHIVLPDGEIRFDHETIEDWLRSRSAPGVPTNAE